MDEQYTDATTASLGGNDAAKATIQGWTTPTMKHARKLASLLLALVMVFALATTAFAADTNGQITISNPVDGQTYNAYLMFELESYNTETGAYSYKITEDWREFVTTGAGKDYFTVQKPGLRTDSR